MNSNNNFSKLRLELKIKDAIIRELIVVISENKIKIPENLLKNIETIYNLNLNAEGDKKND